MAIRNGVEYLDNVDGNSQRIWELFQFVRSEAKHEHVLLMGRVTWYITCQSFLITIYAVTYHQRHVNWFSNIALPGLAIAVSFLAYFMIDGAVKTIDHWGDLRNQLVRESMRLNSGGGLNPIVIPRWRMIARAEGAHSSDLIHNRSLWFPRCITFVFAAFWITVPLLSCIKPW